MNLCKVKTYLGFSKKMGKLSYGQSVLKDLKYKCKKLVIIDAGASENTKDKYISACKSAGVKYIELPCGEIADAVGKPNVRVICVKDEGLIRVILENLD